MKKVILISIALALVARADATTLDLGPWGSSYYRAYDFSALNGTEFNGQTISVDLTFSTQVHLFQGTWSGFLISFAFLTSGGESFMLGTGYVTDINGNPMIPTDSILGSANTTNVMYVGLFPCYYGLGQPADIYGVHFDLTLPDLDATIAAGGISFYDDDFVYRGHRANPFRIGPHVPENGSTLWLLATTSLLLIATKLVFRHDAQT